MWTPGVVRAWFGMLRGGGVTLPLLKVYYIDAKKPDSQIGINFGFFESMRHHSLICGVCQSTVDGPFICRPVLRAITPNN